MALVQIPLDANTSRDARNKIELQKLGWRVIEVWECEVCDLSKLSERLRREFGLPKNCGGQVA